MQGLGRWLSEDGPRGLESYSSRLHAIRRQRHLLATKHAVLIEQARQIIFNGRSDELLALHSLQSSERARCFAALLGRLDEYVAHEPSNDHASISNRTTG